MILSHIYLLMNKTFIDNPWKEKKTVICNKYEADINQIIIHKAISHGYLDSNPELRNALLRNIRANKELRTKLNEITDEVYETYDLSKSQVTNWLNPTSQARETIDSETISLLFLSIFPYIKQKRLKLAVIFTMCEITNSDTNRKFYWSKYIKSDTRLYNN